jgi:hypothetical protein
MVRFQLLLFLRRFIAGFDLSWIDPGEVRFETHIWPNLLAQFLKCKRFDKNTAAEAVDAVCHSDNFLTHAYGVVLFIIQLYAEDPHPAICKLARQLLDSIRRQAQALEADDSVVDEQNGLLHRIALRNLLETTPWTLEADEDRPNEISVSEESNKESETVLVDFRIEEISRQQFDPILKVAFGRDDEETAAVIATEKGTVFVWKPGRVPMSTTLRVSMNPAIVAVRTLSIVYNVDSEGIIYRWNLIEERIIKYWETGINEEITAIAIDPSNNECLMVRYRNGIIREFDLSEDQCGESKVISDGGNWTVWGKERELLEKQTEGGSLRDLDVNQKFGLIVFVREEGSAFWKEMNGEVIHPIEIEKVTTCAFHPDLPMVAIGTENGEFVAFRFVGQ